MKIWKILFLVFAVSVTGFTVIFFSKFNSKQNDVNKFASLKFVFNENKKIDNPLGKIVMDNPTGAQGDYAIVIKNMKTSESFYLNEHKAFQTGSLYKLWVMAVVFDQLKKGNFKIDDILSKDVSSLNDEFNLPADAAELTDGTITLSVKDALYQMITISHNYAALLLTEKIKVSFIKKYLNEKQFNESNVSEDLPVSTASDIEDFFEKLYKEELSDKDSTGQMLQLLKQQKLNNKLPKYLPDDVIIAHKTGELESFTHDAGIVYTSKGDYIITVLSDSEDPSGAEERIAIISKAVYEYFNK